MSGYVVAVWDVADRHATAYAHELVTHLGTLPYKAVLELAGCTVLSCNSMLERPQRFPVGRGILLGRLFHAPGTHADDSAPEPVSLSAVAAERVISTSGRELIEHYWGDYVAIFREWNCSAIRIVRSPFATLNALHTRIAGLDIYCSDLKWCPGIVSFSINWPQLIGGFIGPQCPGRTHLNNVRELGPGYGERIFQGQIASTCLWDPVRMAAARPIDDPRVAARALRIVTRACVQGRASEFRNVVLSLSGGLDSSITLACLDPNPSERRVFCLTQYLEGDESDERYYARLASSRYHRTLHEHCRSDIPDLSTALYPHPLAYSPGLRLPSVDRVECDYARSMGARGVFYGHGGDELFLRVQQPLYVSDFLKTRGLHREVLPLLMHAAHAEGVTVWQMVVRCLWQASKPGPFDLVSVLSQDLESASLLRSDVLADSLNAYRRTLRTRFEGSGLGPGRLWQVFLLAARREFSSPFDRWDDPIRIAPLLSQPIVELCLAIPTWFQMQGRRDRALARDAFACDLPEQIVVRRDKGGAESLAGLIVQKNLPFLREMLFDGLMARSGLIDRDRLESALADAPSSNGVRSVPLFDLLGAEIWARVCADTQVTTRQNSARINK